MTNRRKIIILLTIIEIVVLIFIGFLIFLQLKGVKKVSEELIGLKRELILFQDEAGELERAKETYWKLEPGLKEIARLFPDPGIPIGLIRFWENIAAESGLLIEVSPIFIKSVETDPWESMGFQLVLAGSVGNFLRFLEKIEAGSYLTEVQSLVISKQEKETGGSGVRAILLAKIFTK
ncbi:MAG: hypothetical protein FJZ07_00155 [Candidatus Nealsonbacteria bacterium]|nr:hypothetical protein [Candidatus Nealsonbacteria bacterium]